MRIIKRDDGKGVAVIVQTTRGSVPMLGQLARDGRRPVVRLANGMKVVK